MAARYSKRGSAFSRESGLNERRSPFEYDNLRFGRRRQRRLSAVRRLFLNLGSFEKLPHPKGRNMKLALNSLNMRSLLMHHSPLFGCTHSKIKNLLPQYGPYPVALMAALQPQHLVRPPIHLDYKGCK